MQRILKIFRIGAAAAVVLALVLIAWQCLDIYIAGSGLSTADEADLRPGPIYTRADVAARLETLRAPLAACAAVIAAAIILHALFGDGRTRRVPMTPENRLRLLKKQAEALPEAARKEEDFRRKIGVCAFICVFVCAAVCLGHLLNPRSFPDWQAIAPEVAMGNMLLQILPPLSIAFLVWIAASFKMKASVLREIDLIKDVPKSGSAPAREKSFRLAPARVLLYALAAMFIVLGVMNGGARDVFYKAINICTECIGLG